MSTEILQATAITRQRRVVYDTYANLPTTGLFAGDLAFATDRLTLYRWSGSAWQSITIYSSSGVAASIPTASNLPNGSVYYETDTNKLKQVQAGAWVQITELLTNTLTTDGDIFIRNAGAIDRLGIGAAGQLLGISGALPSWVNKPGIEKKLISFTRDAAAADGNVAYTGVGFTPQAILFFGALSGTAGFTIGSQGVAGGSGDRHGIACGYGDALFFPVTQPIVLAQTSTVFAYAFINSFDADGFTLTWSKLGTPNANTWTIKAFALRVN